MIDRLGFFVEEFAVRFFDQFARDRFIGKAQQFELFSFDGVVGNEEVFDLIENVVAQAFDRARLANAFHLSGSGDEAVVAHSCALFGLFCFHHAEEPRFDETAGERRFIH